MFTVCSSPKENKQAPHLCMACYYCGEDRIRTDDLLTARVGISTSNTTMQTHIILIFRYLIDFDVK